MVLAEQIKEIEQRREALERCLDIEQKRIDLRNEEEKTQEPNFWDEPDKAREQLRKVAAIKAWVDDYDAVRKDAEDLALMPDFVKEGVVTEAEMDAHYAATLEKIGNLEMRNMLRREEDKLGAILDINAGAGGTEALDWASMLMRMYTRWGEAHGYKVKVLDYQAGDEVGVKSCTMEFEGEYAYGYLKSENGVHRMVRLSPFNANNKRQTTFASVFVSPAVDDTIEITVNPSDIESGHVPLVGRRRPERQQGRDGGAPALPRQGCRHGRTRGVPDREHGDPFAADEPRERHAHPQIEALPA